MTQANSQRTVTALAASQGDEFLTFTLGEAEYGIEILTVQEIRSYDAVTAIANAPDFIKGVINLRGIIVPVVDMRIKFHLGKVEYDPLTVVIILNIADRVIGMVVDSVSDVIALTPARSKPRPNSGRPSMPGTWWDWARRMNAC